jgi:hypothetical protein
MKTIFLPVHYFSHLVHQSLLVDQSLTCTFLYILSHLRNLILTCTLFVSPGEAFSHLCAFTPVSHLEQRSLTYALFSPVLCLLPLENHFLTCMLLHLFLTWKNGLSPIQGAGAISGLTLVKHSECNCRLFVAILKPSIAGGVGVT